MTLSECTEKGIDKVRKAVWADPDAHLELDLMEGGKRGPWGHLYDKASQDAMDVECPQDILVLGDTADDWEEYISPDGK
jgi:hypothetical protein